MEKKISVHNKEYRMYIRFISLPFWQSDGVYGTTFTLEVWRDMSQSLVRSKVDRGRGTP
jgi:hypothetical protein